MIGDEKELVSLSLFVAWHAYDYAMGLLDDDLVTAYDLHRRALLALQGGQGTRLPQGTSCITS